MSVKIKKYNNISWLDVTDLDDKDISYLKNNYKFHALDIKDLGNEAQRSKIDVYQQYAFIILKFPFKGKDNEIFSSHELAIFLGKDYLITVQKGKIKTLNQYFFRLSNNKKLLNEVFSGSAGLLLYYILHELYSHTLSITDILAKEINKIEEDVYEQEARKSVRKLAWLRRNVLFLKSVVSAQLFVFKTLMQQKNAPYFNDDDLANYYDDLADMVKRIYSHLDISKELIEGLHEINESLNSYRLNRAMKILTIFSVSMLPLTLLTGIYGMNLKTLPLAHEESLVWYIFGGLTLVIIIIILSLRKKDVI